MKCPDNVSVRFILILMVSSVLVSCSCRNNDEIPLTLYGYAGRADDQAENFPGDGSDNINIILTGDTMLSRNVEYHIREKNDYDYPFSMISGLVRESEIAFTNLETPLVRGDNIKTGLVFRADPQFAGALKRSGFNTVSLANNHILDMGVAGLSV